MEEQETSGESSNEATEANQSQVEVDETTKSASVVPSTSEPATTATAKNGPGTEQVGQDWPVKYTTLEKSYNELRKKLQEQGTERNQYRNKLETLEKQQAQILQHIAKLTERPYDPDQFMEELRTQGPKALDGLVQKPLSELKSQYDQRLADSDNKYRTLETRYEIQERKLNPEKYPDFAKLESEMTQAFLNGGLPFPTGPEVPIGEVIDSLYNYVRLQHSQDAIKAAEQLGHKKAEAELAREAHTGVAGGGKTAGLSVVDYEKMPLAKLREIAVKQFGEATM
jgi:hypothetical protein